MLRPPNGQTRCSTSDANLFSFFFFFTALAAFFYHFVNGANNGTWLLVCDAHFADHHSGFVPFSSSHHSIVVLRSVQCFASEQKKNGVVVSSVFFFSSVSVTVFHSKSLLFTRMRRRLNTPSDELHRFQLIHSSTKSCRNQMILDTRLICKISVHKLAYLARRCKNEWKRSNAIRNWTTNNFRV